MAGLIERGFHIRVFLVDDVMRPIDACSRLLHERIEIVERLSDVVVLDGR